MHTLSEKDSMWLELRHRHFADACNDISGQMESFRTKNAAARHRSGGGGQLDVRDMRRLVQALPQFRRAPLYPATHPTRAYTCSPRTHATTHPPYTLTTPVTRVTPPVQKSPDDAGHPTAGLWTQVRV